jgi:hypothetical protein
MGVPSATARMDEGHERDAHAENADLFDTVSLLPHWSLYQRKTEFSTGNRLNMILLCISYSDIQ